jgi:hypothetical protein
MFKKLSTSVLTLALVACVIAPAVAQDTIGLYGDLNLGAGLSRYINTTPGQSFDIIAFTKTDAQSSAAEFIMSELNVLYPSVFKLQTTKINNTPLDLGDNSVGEYIMAYQGCISAGGAEVVRVQYGDFAGDIPTDVVLKLRALGPGDGFSSFDGTMGYVDCTEGQHILMPEPWVDFDSHDPTQDPNTDSADGVVVLNADLIPNEFTSVGSLKARF